MSATIDGTNGVTAATLVPSGSSAPTNGIYLPTTNVVAIATNGTVGLKVNSNGNVSMPLQPSFVASLTNNSDQTYTNTTLPFNIVTLNRGGGTFNTSSYYYQVPTSGYYLFQCSTYGTSSAGSATMYHYFLVNGSAPSGSRPASDVYIGTSSGQVSICAIQAFQVINCNSGDQVSVYSSAYNSSAVYRIYTGTSLFQGTFLG